MVVGTVVNTGLRMKRSVCWVVVAGKESIHGSKPFISFS
jgi:hypothetical protein